MMFTFKSFRQTYPLSPAKVSFNDLKRICVELYELNQAAKLYEKNYYEILYPVLAEDTEEIKIQKEKSLKREKEGIDNGSLIVITVEGGSGELFQIIPGDDLDKIFSSLYLPHKILRIRFDNWSHYKIQEGKLPNYCLKIEIDFSDHVIWRFNESNSENKSHIEVSGPDETWVLGTINKLKKIPEKRSLKFSKLVHGYLNYDFLLWIVGIPGTILALKSFDFLVTFFQNFPNGLQTVIYISLSLLLLLSFRTFYNYFKWLFPYMEMCEQQKYAQFFQRSVAIFIYLGIISGWLSLISQFFLSLH